MKINLVTVTNQDEPINTQSDPTKASNDAVEKFTKYFSDSLVSTTAIDDQAGVIGQSETAAIVQSGRIQVGQIEDGSVVVLNNPPSITLIESA